MRIFTKNEADSAVKYYSDKIIGKPITDPGDTTPYIVSSLRISKINEDEYTIKCIVSLSNNIAFRNLESTIQYLNLLPLEEFLSNPDL